jgi:hypothetical protein
MATPLPSRNNGLIRAFAEETYDISREHVIGSSARLRYDTHNGSAVLMKRAELNSFDDHEAKVQNIGLHIGRRPILAFGNSDVDLAMPRLTCSGREARLALLLHHDDAEREVAPDREFRLSPLTEALDRANDYGMARRDHEARLGNRVRRDARAQRQGGLTCAS